MEVIQLRVNKVFKQAHEMSCYIKSNKLQIMY